MRKGKLIYVFSGPIIGSRCNSSVTFEQYVVNGYGFRVLYHITIIPLKLRESGINTKVTNGIITYPNQTNYHYSHNKTYTMTAGSLTPFDITDDVYTVNGNSSFSDSAGNSLVCNITTPLVKAVSCHNVSRVWLAFPTIRL